MSSWFTSAFENVSKSNTNIEPLKKIPRINTKPNLKNKTQISQSINSTNWIDNFAPECVEDLAVHNKKIQEVRDWLQQSISNKKNGNILLLTGPTGSGKTATIRVLSKVLGFQLNEWVTPMDTNVYHENKYNDSDGYSSIEKQSDRFMEFLLKASRYNSLFDVSNRRLVLVEDFPNYLLRDHNAIQDVLGKYKQWGKSPLVFICTDVKGKEINIANNIFSDSVRNQFQINNISFNPVSTTGLKSALKRVANLMSKMHNNSYKAQTNDIIDAIVNSSIGDVRSAIINLHFSSLKGTNCVQTETQSSSSKRKSKGSQAKATGKLKTMGRDESLGLLHGVGRVLNPKRVDTPQGFRLTHPISEIVDNFLSQPMSFINFLHQNYPVHFNDIEDCVEAINDLSQADQMSCNWSDRDVSSDYALYIAIGGLMLNNKDPVKKWCPVKGPNKLQINVPSCKEMSLGLEHTVHKHSLAIDFKTYSDIIKNNLRASAASDESEPEIIEDV